MDTDTRKLYVVEAEKKGREEMSALKKRRGAIRIRWVSFEGTS